mmetsp:Transcript_11534/g.15485  ORF Transcript_11534/g.15485 Transcript_11534/m.15485 type:complete len:92 (+) Transcript_11534:637-912(+)
MFIFGDNGLMSIWTLGMLLMQPSCFLAHSFLFFVQLDVYLHYRKLSNYLTSSEVRVFVNRRREKFLFFRVTHVFCMTSFFHFLSLVWYVFS